MLCVSMPPKRPRTAARSARIAEGPAKLETVIPVDRIADKAVRDWHLQETDQTGETRHSAPIGKPRPGQHIELEVPGDTPLESIAAIGLADLPDKVKEDCNPLTTLTIVESPRVGDPAPRRRRSDTRLAASGARFDTALAAGPLNRRRCRTPLPWPQARGESGAQNRECKIRCARSFEMATTQLAA